VNQSRCVDYCVSTIVVLNESAPSLCVANDEAASEECDGFGCPKIVEMTIL
jgi:hypothetical protein